MLDQVYSATWKEAIQLKWNVETTTAMRAWPTALGAKSNCQHNVPPAQVC